MPNRGRVSVEKLAKARETTYEMAALRCKTRDIAEEVGFTQMTVRGWIREGKASGELVIRPGREIVIEMTRENRPVEEIEAATNYSRGYIRNIQLELRGKPLKKNPRPKENVEKFLADPAAHLGKPFTQTPPFAKALIQRCVSTVDKNPADLLEMIDPVVDLFTGLAELLTGEARSATLCRLLQARGIKAHALSETGEHDAAVALVESGFVLAEGRCVACGADYRRRHGFALGYRAYTTGEAQDWRQAIDDIGKAIEDYRSLCGEDHDLHGNGLAHCYLDLSQVRYYAVDAATAAADARAGIALIDEGTSESMCGMLIHSLAAALMESDSRHELYEAQRLMSARLQATGDVISLPAALTKWLAALIENKLGDFRKASFLLEDALEVAQELKRPVEVAAIAADLGTVSPNPRNIKALVEGLGVEREGYLTSEAAAPLLPQWIESGLRRSIRSLYEAAGTACPRRIVDECRALRAAAEQLVANPGVQLLPAFY